MADHKFRIVVAGAGVSGLFMAETLKRARIDFAVYEKAREVGGTWRDNTFPGFWSKDKKTPKPSAIIQRGRLAPRYLPHRQGRIVIHRSGDLGPGTLGLEDDVTRIKPFATHHRSALVVSKFGDGAETRATEPNGSRPPVRVS